MKFIKCKNCGAELTKDEVSCEDIAGSGELDIQIHCDHCKSFGFTFAKINCWVDPDGNDIE